MRPLRMPALPAPPFQTRHFSLSPWLQWVQTMTLTTIALFRMLARKHASATPGRIPHTCFLIVSMALGTSYETAAQHKSLGPVLCTRLPRPARERHLQEPGSHPRRMMIIVVSSDGILKQENSPTNHSSSSLRFGHAEPWMPSPAKCQCPRSIWIYRLTDDRWWRPRA